QPGRAHWLRAAGAGTRENRQCRLAQRVGGASRRPRERARRIQTLEKRAAELESVGEELQRELTLAQQAARGLEGDKTELTSEIGAVRAEIANLESQLAQETANGRALSEANQILVDHSNSADKRIVELQSEGALIREKLLLLENDKRSLQTALDQTLAETS